MDSATITSLISSITSILTAVVGAGWAGIAGLAGAVILLIVGSFYGVKYFKNKVYTSDVNNSNASAGTEAIKASNADNAAKQSADQLQLENEALLKKQELKTLADSMTKKNKPKTKTTTKNRRRPAKKAKKARKS
jgi:hypothetical protein